MGIRIRWEGLTMFVEIQGPEDDSAQSAGAFRAQGICEDIAEMRAWLLGADGTLIENDAAAVTPANPDDRWEVVFDHVPAGAGYRLLVVGDLVGSFDWRRNLTFFEPLRARRQRGRARA